MSIGPAHSMVWPHPWTLQWAGAQLLHVLLAWLLVYIMYAFLGSKQQAARQRRAAGSKKETSYMGAQDAACQTSPDDDGQCSRGQLAAQAAGSDVQLGLLMLQLCGSACQPEQLNDMYGVICTLLDSLHRLQHLCIKYASEQSTPSLACSHASTPKQPGTPKKRGVNTAANLMTPPADTPAKSCKSISRLGPDIVTPLAHAIIRAMLNDSRGAELHTARAVHSRVASHNDLLQCAVEAAASGLGSPKFSMDTQLEFCWLLPPLHMLHLTTLQTDDVKGVLDHADELTTLPELSEEAVQAGQQETGGAGHNAGSTAAAVADAARQHVICDDVAIHEACSTGEAPAQHLSGYTVWSAASPAASQKAEGSTLAVSSTSHAHSPAVHRRRHYSDSPCMSPVKRVGSSCASESGAFGASRLRGMSRSSHQASMWVQDESLLLSEVALWAARAARAEQQAQEAQRAAGGALEQMGLLEEAIAGCHEREAHLQGELEAMYLQVAEQVQATQQLAAQHLRLIACIQKAVQRLRAAGRQDARRNARLTCRLVDPHPEHARSGGRLRVASVLKQCSRHKSVYKESVRLLRLGSILLSQQLQQP